MEGGMNMNMNIGWILTLLVLFNVISISISAVDKLAGQSDSYIYGLCNANKYSSGSEYERNLKRVLQSLVDGAGGLATHTYGGIHGLVQCRPDVSHHDCKSCSAAATQTAFQGCPNAIAARVQFEFCFIRYENYTFASALDTTLAYAVDASKSNHNIHGFNHTLGNLMATLARKAPLHVNRFATGAGVVMKHPSTVTVIFNRNHNIHCFNHALGNLMATLARKAPLHVNRFATGAGVVMKHPSTVTVYGLQMCLTTLSAPDCRVCLTQAIGVLSKCCSSQMGAQVYLGSCSARFQTYPF